ncbi:MAG TPA: hypothetical protein VG713_04815 [Pirellulales bacterium]|nr:hypothetical protein [Pirellulales bacterium]
MRGAARWQACQSSSELLAFLSADLSAAALRAGAATSNITPSTGFEVLGSFDPQPSQHIHDELQARCMVLDDGSRRIALVV